MYLYYAGYTHQLDECTIAISTDTLRDADGLPTEAITKWAIRGELHADDQASLITAMQALEAAYANDGGDIKLLCNDGLTVAHSILSNDTDSGVRITRRPSYPIGTGAELSTFRTFELAVEATTSFEERLGSIISYQETLEFAGGGTERKFLTLRNGPPQRQTISQATPYLATQSGSAVGFDFWPSHPAPYWPEPIYDSVNSKRSLGTPEPSGEGRRRVYRKFPIFWSYQFASERPLTGRPTRKD